MADEIIVRMALPVILNKYFSYIIPTGLIDDDLIGRRALAPFGSKTVTGVIVGFDEKKEEIKYKKIIELLDEKPVFSKNILEFTAWMAEYYMSSHGEILRAAMPSGMSPESYVKVRISNILTDDEIGQMAKKAPKKAALYILLQNSTGELSVKYLESKLKTDSVASQLESLENLGIIECEEIIEGDSMPLRQKALIIDSILFDDELKLKEILDSLDKSAHKQSLILSHVYLHQRAEGTPALLSETLRASGASHSSVISLIEKGYLKTTEIIIDRSKRFHTEDNLSARDETILKLTEEQKKASDTINESVENGGYKPFLLHGVTGSGKTLVYIDAIRKALSIGKTALMLVPEISLTPQLIDRLKVFFPEELTVLHSRMSRGERLDSWRSILKKESKLVLGARSALFAPLENIGIIIVDEEHESSYKQNSPSPRYNARDCSLVLGRIEGATIVLGSATPSMESMYNARSGRYGLLEIKDRADGALLPDIRIINPLEARKQGAMRGIFSDILLNEAAERVEKKEGVILFLNRRGFSSYLECPECSAVPMCINCSLALTYHKKIGQLRCHYCGYSEPAGKACVVCGNPELHEFGSGTQKIEEELAEALEKIGIKAEIARMDHDTTLRKGSYRKLLSAFAEGKTDILVGTQMVAKGLDFARVSLIGAVNADIQLFLSNFRASERTFQLLTQVSGRAGRSREYRGEVIIQTSHPDNPAIVAVLRSSYDEFYENEIIHRQDALYPPFSRFVHIEFSSKDEKKADSHAKIFAGQLPDRNK
ncbi:MAG: hypothetical protein QG635_1789, partial [Bacteroidota bacterium]|nr:hypothetical protein [Bacteroidota bacterium]